MNNGKVLITGSENFHDYECFERVLETILLTRHEVVTSNNGGTDYLAKQYARNHNLMCTIIDKDTSGGKNSYKVLNDKLVKTISSKDLLICFYDGKNQETKHLLDLAKKKKIHTYIKYVD